MDLDAGRAYPLLIDTLRLLPVQPFREREELGLARHLAQRRGFGEVRGVRLPAKDLDELFVQKVPGAPRVSSRGAQVLLDLLRRGALEIIHRRAKDDVELLEAYAQGQASITGLGYWKKPPRRTKPPSAPNALTRTTTNVSVHWDRESAYRVTTHRLT